MNDIILQFGIRVYLRGEKLSADNTGIVIHHVPEPPAWMSTLSGIHRRGQSQLRLLDRVVERRKLSDRAVVPPLSAVRYVEVVTIGLVLLPAICPAHPLCPSIWSTQ